MGKKRLLILAVLLLLITSSANFYGCRGYKKFSMNEGIGHFSFEYPSRYKLEFVRMENIFGEVTRVSFLYTSTTKEAMVNLYHDADILIEVEREGARYKNSDEVLESEINWWTSRGYDDFRLLERSNTGFAGMRGGQIVYSFDSLHLYDASINMNLIITPAVCRIAVADQGGLIWFISVTGRENLSDMAKADFEHILKTFKILN